MTIKKKTATKPASRAAAKKAAPVKAAPKPRAKAAAPAPRRRAPATPAADPAAPILPAADAAQGDIFAAPEGGNLSGDAMAHLGGLAAAAAQDEAPAAPPPGADAPAGEGDAGPSLDAEAARMGAMVGAHMAVAMGERAVAHYYPFVTVEPEQKASLAAALADVLAKYAGNGQLPPWVVQYVLPFIEELKLLAKLGTIGYAIYAQVQAEKARLQREAEERARQQQQRPAGGLDLATGGA